MQHNFVKQMVFCAVGFIIIEHAIIISSMTINNLLCLATYHIAYGLQFSEVFLPNFQQSLFACWQSFLPYDSLLFNKKIG